MSTGGLSTKLLNSLAVFTHAPGDIRSKENGCQQKMWKGSQIRVMPKLEQLQ